MGRGDLGKELFNFLQIKICSGLPSWFQGLRLCASKAGSLSTVRLVREQRSHVPLSVAKKEKVCSKTSAYTWKVEKF